MRVPDYPIFMAVTKRIGHDKRGKSIYVRDSDGQDVLAQITQKEVVVEDGHEVVRETVESVPVVDDDLPRIPPVFRDWARNNHLGL